MSRNDNFIAVVVSNPQACSANDERRWPGRCEEVLAGETIEKGRVSQLKRPGPIRWGLGRLSYRIGSEASNRPVSAATFLGQIGSRISWILKRNDIIATGSKHQVIFHFGRFDDRFSHRSGHRPANYMTNKKPGAKSASRSDGESQFRALIETALDLVVVLNCDGTIR